MPIHSNSYCVISHSKNVQVPEKLAKVWQATYVARNICGKSNWREFTLRQVTFVVSHVWGKWHCGKSHLRQVTFVVNHIAASLIWKILKSEKNWQKCDESPLRQVTFATSHIAASLIRKKFRVYKKLAKSRRAI